ncbi:MAG: XdhC family protein [Bacteroidia bacterium]
MIDIFSDIQQRVKKNQPFALATVIRTWGSSPRQTGAALAVSADMYLTGSVSGGCVEGTVAQKALEVLETGKPQILEFGISNENAWAVGLTCGGELTVFVEKFPAFSAHQSEMEVWTSLENAVINNLGGTLLSRMNGDAGAHTFVFPDGTSKGEVVSEKLSSLALDMWKLRKNQVLTEGENQYFALTIPRKSRLLMIGAVHIAVELTALAARFGFETIVIDPRGFFADNTLFSTTPDQLLRQWPAEVLESLAPDAYTYAVILSHDPKIDDQALDILLNAETAYIGALGSRKNHEKRCQRMREKGFSEDQIGRIHGPVGFDIGAKTAGEIALSILAEIIAVKNGK